MMRNLVTLTLLLFLAAAMPAATVNTTLTVNASAATPTGTSLTATGTASLTNGIGSGTFTATFSLVTVSGPYTITLSNGTITGTITTTLAILTGSATGSATVTGGTGTFSGATGSFTLSGTGSAGATGNINLTFTGPGSITASGLTGGGTTGPAITQVLDAASITDTVAPGSIFIVKGTNLCPSGVNFFNTLPRPTVAPDGVKITFTPTTGSATDAILWYEYNPSGTCQLAAILPSTVAVGTYNVTVTNGTVSAPATAKVVQSKFGFFTQDSTGSGLAVAQTIITATRYDLNRFTSGSVSGVTISPSHPGAPMVTYGTGLGAVPASVGDNLALPIYDFTTHGVTVNAIVGGMTIPVSFAGRAGFAAEDQVNFTLPANVPTGCTVSFQLSVNGTLSAPTFLAIAPTTGATECVQPGFTATQLKNFDNGGTYTVGYFSLSQVQETVPGFGTFTSNSANGAFTRFTGFELSGAAQAAPNSSGACTVVHSTSSSTTPTIVAGGTGLDAGTVTLNGPTGSSISNLAFQQNTDPTNSSYNSYSLTLAGPAGGTGTIVPGQYTVAGAGGKDVNKFNSSITVGTPIAVTGGLPTSINRSAGLTLNWTGGNTTDIVQLFGASSTTTGTGSSAVTDSWAFTCYTTAGAQTLTVPASILQQLPAATLSSSGSGGGLLTFSSSTVPTSFTATLTAGGSIDSGVFSAFVGSGALVSYQ